MPVTLVEFHEPQRCSPRLGRGRTLHGVHQIGLVTTMITVQHCRHHLRDLSRHVASVSGVTDRTMFGQRCTQRGHTTRPHHARSASSSSPWPQATTPCRGDQTPPRSGTRQPHGTNAPERSSTGPSPPVPPKSPDPTTRTSTVARSAPTTGSHTIAPRGTLERPVRPTAPRGALLSTRRRQ
jgi:hypothetical protein